ncbi:MAG: 16S rRNA (guanine(527)-N(7))-methyltransferase RsmG [Brucellaceae bacterium]|nr:16S rRNA (guanine(527)-N(7))-methyltransferase RsmG [Brucellaceae bacterium]
MSGDRLAQLRNAAGQDVSRETLDALEAFEAHFRHWNARINLVAPSTLPDLWERHIIDSAQLLRLAGAPTLFLDLGSGGGFPALVIALLLKGRDGAHVDMVESNNKKAAFLRDSVMRFGLPATVHACRIEQAVERVAMPQIVTARALAALDPLLALASPWLGHGATGLFHKGRDYRQEVDESRAHWEFDLIEHASTCAADSVILEISGLQPRGGT